MFKECCITPHHSGFGMWQRGELNGDAYDDEQDLVESIRSCGRECWELGKDDLPSDVENIAGKIYGDVDRVFAVRFEDDKIGYFGIVDIGRDEERVEKGVLLAANVVKVHSTEGHYSACCVGTGHVFNAGQEKAGKPSAGISAGNRSDVDGGTTMR